MGRLGIILMVLLLLTSPGLTRADDVCTLRPDLCGGKIKKKHFGRGGGRKKCRSPRDHRNATASLPICSEAALAAQEMYRRELREDPRFGSKDTREGIPDESFAAKPRKTDLDIDRYVNQNAGDPALARKQNLQQAFVEQNRGYTYGFSGGTPASNSASADGLEGVTDAKKDSPPVNPGDREPASSATNR